MPKDIIDWGVDKTQLVTLRHVVNMLNKWPHKIVIKALEDGIKELEIKTNSNPKKPETDDDGFELPHLDPEDDPDTRLRMEADNDPIHE